MSNAKTGQSGIDTIEQNQEFFEEVAASDLRISKWAGALLEVAEE